MLLLIALIGLSGGLGLAQSGLSMEIERVHGGEALRRLENHEVRGTVELPDPISEVSRRVPFHLYVSGDRSRLEMDGRVWVAQGVFGQWRDEDGRASTPRQLWEGFRDVYLTPVFPLSRLAQFGPGAGPANRITLVRSIARRRHYGYRDETYRVELDFHPESLLLSEAIFTTGDEQQTPIQLLYSEFRSHQGVLLPTRVERQVGDNRPQVFHVESVRLHTRPADALFQIDFAR